jgi:hypothetical protein
MNKTICVLAIVVLCSGCSRAFWHSNYDKALSERAQLEEQEKQTKIFERIAISLESIEKNLIEKNLNK